MILQIHSHQLPPNRLIRTHNAQAPSSSHIQRVPIAGSPAKSRGRRLRDTRRVDVARHDRLRATVGRHLGNGVRGVRGQEYVAARPTYCEVVVRGAGEGVRENHGVSLRRAVGVDLDCGQDGLRGVGEMERRAAETESVDAGGGAACGGCGLHEGVGDDDFGGAGLGVDGPDLAVAGVGGEDRRGVEGGETVEELGVWYVGGVRD